MFAHTLVYRGTWEPRPELQNTTFTLLTAALERPNRKNKVHGENLGPCKEKIILHEKDKTQHAVGEKKNQPRNKKTCKCLVTLLSKLF